VPPNFVAVRKSDIFGDDWSSVDDLYEDERKQWLKDNPEPTPTPTIHNSWQTRLPNFDPSMDDPIWGPSVAMRVQGDYPAGSPVRQGEANLGYEDLLDIHSEHPKREQTIPDDDDPTWDPDVESEWERDPETGVRYYYNNQGQKVFLDLEQGMKGSWLARPTRKDASNLYTHTGDPRKLVFVRQNALLGTPMKRDSDQNPEGVAEMFLQHDKHLPKEGLVTVPLRGRSYQHAAAGLGLPEHAPDTGQMDSYGNMVHFPDYRAPSRWSDALLPWQKPEEEGEDWHKVMQGEPMDIAFQLLKDRKSPEAWANKKRYDTQYEKTPKRVKYREQLNAERRRRGIYGKGGADVSHTQGGKLTLEKPSSNRARHFKGKGTLRRVKVK